MKNNSNVSSYQEDIEKELHRRAVVMERILLLISPISVLSLLDAVFIFRAFIDWAFLKQNFFSNPNMVFVGYSRYIILPLVFIIFIYNIYSTRKGAKYGDLQGYV